MDFAAIAPIHLSGDIERLVWTGHNQSHGISDEHSGGGSGDGGGGGRTQDDVCLLSRIPAHLVELVLEYSQPTLVRPDADPVQGGDGAHDVNDNNAGRWRVL